MELRQKLQSRLDNLTKPKGSLGALEEIAMQMGLVQQRELPELPARKAVYVFSGDHGVAEDSVSAYPREVTVQMIVNYLYGGAAINVFARHAGADVFVVDAGVDGDFEPHPCLISQKVARGTRNFTRERAMAPGEAERSVALGREAARHALSLGVEMAAIGDMGIGNTTTATAVGVAMGLPLEGILDIGTVISSEQLQRKGEAVSRAMALHAPFTSPLDVLEKVGGYCIGQMAGFILECASNRLPVVVDGYPTTSAALLAVAMEPSCREMLFAGHLSQVRGHRVFLDHLGLRPIVSLDMRLGEGTGAVLAFNLIEAAIKMIREMATFDSAGVARGNES